MIYLNIEHINKKHCSNDVKQQLCNHSTCISSTLSVFVFFNVHFQGWTPLHTASSGGYDEMVRLLLCVGVDMDITDIEVHTAMVFVIFVDYLCSKFTYLTSMNDGKQYTHLL
jgi:ankyrin repeat protein